MSYGFLPYHKAKLPPNQRDNVHMKATRNNKIAPRQESKKRFILATFLVFSGLIVGLLPTVQAVTPTFDGGTTIGVINQDNDYDVYRNGDLIVIAHAVDTSTNVVVEVSTNGGLTWATRATGFSSDQSSAYSGIRVAAKSSTSIVVISYNTGGTLSAIRTGDGVTWTRVTVSLPAVNSIRAWSITYAGNAYLLAEQECYVAACTTSANPELYQRVYRSFDNGLTWPLPTNVAWESSPGTSVYGEDIVATSESIWTVLAALPIASGQSILARQTTTNAGASITTTAINDAFTPILTAFGGYPSVSDDATRISFLVANKPYVAEQQPGDLWYFTPLSTNTVQLTKSYVFSCPDSTIVTFQGTTGTDRISFATIETSGVTLTPVTGETASSSLPFTTLVVGGNVWNIYGQTSDGKTIIKKTTNTPCLTSEEAATTFIFCSISGDDENDFGYDFREGVTLDTNTGGSDAQDMSSAYSFSGDETDYDYLAKSWTPGETNITTFFRIESATEGHSSVFRTAYSFIPATGTVEEPVLDKGDPGGKKDGDFFDHISIRFQESGNDWIVKFFYVSAGSGSTAIGTQFGLTYTGGNPNTPTQYHFRVNTITGKATLYNNDDAILLEAAIPTVFNNGLMYSQWFVGYSTSAFVARTFLDTHQLSTCIITDDPEVVVNGDPGSEVSNNDTSGDDDTNSGSNTNTGTLGGGFNIPTDAPDNFFGMNIPYLSSQFSISEVAMRWLLGLYVVALVAGAMAGLASGMGSVILIAVGALIGVGVAIAFGLLPVWLLLLILFLMLIFIARMFFGDGESN